MRSETHRWGIVRRPNDLLLFFGEISAEEFSSIRLQPNASIGHFDASEDVGWVLVELILNGLARAGRNRRDEDHALKCRQDLMNESRSGLRTSACVVSMPWG